MHYTTIVFKTKNFVKSRMESDRSGHDWFHVLRVFKLATYIARHEKKAKVYIVQLTALLHDIGDWKFNNNDSSIGAERARAWLQTFPLTPNVIDSICFTVEHISYKGGTNKETMQSVEGKIVQDADRLDALGAIGIARTFTYGGYKGREIYNPKLSSKSFQTLQEYAKYKGTTINHFYEKLLHLKDGMHTQTARKIAEERDAFMREFLEHFFTEWNGNFEK